MLDVTVGAKEFKFLWYCYCYLTYQLRVFVRTLIQSLTSLFPKKKSKGSVRNSNIVRAIHCYDTRGCWCSTKVQRKRSMYNLMVKPWYFSWTVFLGHHLYVSLFLK